MGQGLVVQPVCLRRGQTELGAGLPDRQVVVVPENDHFLLVVLEAEHGEAQVLIGLGARLVVPLDVEFNFAMVGPGADLDVVEEAVLDDRVAVARLGEDLASRFFVGPGLLDLDGRLLRNVFCEHRVPGVVVGPPQDL